MAKGIYKRGKYYWIRYAGLDGRVIRESTGSTKFKDAEDKLLQKKKMVREGKEPVSKRIEKHTFKELAVEYIRWAERQRAFRQKRDVVRHLVSVFGQYQLRVFNTRLLEQYQTARLRKGNKPGTINRHIAIMKHMFRKAVEWDMVEEEALKRVRKVKLLPENNRRLRYLSIEECRALIERCDAHLRPIVVTALNTGMRKGEILSLKWENVDLKHGFILIDVSKNGERREVPINDTLRETLKGINRRLDVPYVFINPQTGEPYGDLKRSFPSACRRAGIEDFRFHDLRHTFASHLVMAGVDITTVRELLGHKTLTMTLRYAHLASSHKVRALETLNEKLNDRSSAQLLHNLAIEEGAHAR